MRLNPDYSDGDEEKPSPKKLIITSLDDLPKEVAQHVAQYKAKIKMMLAESDDPDAKFDLLALMYYQISLLQKAVMELDQVVLDLRNKYE